jgi:hypothetical protein
MSKIHFPFLRAQKYTFGELRAFEAALLKARQQDAVFSGDLRSNKVSWAKTRNEELLPIGLLADHKGFADSDKFELMPEGHSTDVQAHTGTHITCYQITVADPAWTIQALVAAAAISTICAWSCFGWASPHSAARTRERKMAL